jgi:hypothetical protein
VVMSPDGLGTTDHCAGGRKLQFSGQCALLGATAMLPLVKTNEVGFMRAAVNCKLSKVS